MKILHFKKAFTMLELVFVIVILGIVSSIGAEIIAKVYKSYHIQRATYRSSIKINLASTQIVNRLTYAIPSTIIGRKSNSDSTYKSAEGMNDINSSNNYTVLQWIAYDADSFGSVSTTGKNPGWSGFADLDSTTNSTITTRGSDLGIVGTIIDKLSKTAGTITKAIVLFPNEYYVENIGYDTTSPSDISGLHKINSASGETITVNSMVGKTIHEHYKLAWSSYALVPTNERDVTDPDGSTKKLYDLELRYDFQPWNGSHYNNVSTPSELLIQNVSLFKFFASATSIRFKLCQREYITKDFFINTCKEKVVIR